MLDNFEKNETFIQIVLEIPSDIRTQILNCQAALKQRFPNTHFPYPVVVIFRIILSDQHFDPELFKTIFTELTSQKIKAFPVSFGRIISNTFRPDLVLWSITKKPVYDVHIKSVNALHPYWSRQISQDDRERIKNNIFDHDQIRLTNKYGYPYVFRQFRPCIHLAEVGSLATLDMVKKYFKNHLFQFEKHCYMQEKITLHMYQTSPYQVIDRQEINLD